MASVCSRCGALGNNLRRHVCSKPTKALARIPGRLVARLFTGAFLSMADVAVCMRALYPRLHDVAASDCENAFRRYVNRRRREGRAS
jgi:hypothetical protein